MNPLPLRFSTLLIFFAAAFPALAAVPQARFDVADKPLGPPLVGFGVQLNPYLYCQPNWGGVNEDNVENLEAKVIDLHPQHVRIFTLLHWFTGGDDPISKKDLRVKESFLRTVRLSQRAGATVNLTLWYGPFPDPEKSMGEFADVLAHLIRDEKLTAIQYVTLLNEVNGDETKCTMQQYNRLYRGLDAGLRRQNIRDRIKIIGGDLVYLHQEAWFNNMSANLADVLDGYSTHVYWNYWDTHRLLQRVCEVPPIVNTLPQQGRKPLYITEFGVRGHHLPHQEPGNDDAGHLITATTTAAAQVGWFMMEAINRGYLATVQWDGYDAIYDRAMHYGVIGSVSSGWELRPGYHLLRLFTHTISPGWQSQLVTGAYDGLIVSALSDGSQHTYIALNYGPDVRDVTIGRVVNGVVLHRFTWNANGDGTTRPAGDDHASGGVVNATLRPQSMCVWTTR